MKPLALLTLLFLSACALAASDTAPEKPAPVAADRYSVILRRNIFAKDRQNLNADGTTIPVVPVTAPKPPPKPESVISLVGVIVRDGKLSAVLENHLTGKTWTLFSGDAVASGQIGVITLESIEYSAKSDAAATPTVTVVAMGRTLDGNTPPVADAHSDDPPASGSTPSSNPGSGSGSAPSTPGAPARSTPPVTSGSGGNDVLERMRRKRQEELKK